MIVRAARAIKGLAPQVRLVLGGISPIDPNFIKLLAAHGVLEDLDAPPAGAWALEPFGAAPQEQAAEYIRCHLNEFVTA